jgi:nitrite reductase (NADH) large subunit
MSQFIIIGAGAAGFAAAETIRKYRPHATIRLITDDPYGYYSRPGLAYMLTHELPEQQLFPCSERYLACRGLELLHGQVTYLNPRDQSVMLADGRRYCYDALLLATGAGAVPPPFPGADAPGVVTLDNLDDVHRITQLARRAKSAVVVGGGITALELVEGLHAQKVQVHYFLRRERFWSSVLDDVESKIVEDRLVHDGVQIHRHTEIQQILVKKDWRGRRRVAGVETTNGETIKCDIVAVAIGVRPRLELVKETGIPVDRGILVNERLETEVSGIFAAGDVAQVLDPLTGKSQLDSLWPVAVAQGRIAGANMAGVPVKYRRGVPLNATRLTGLIVTFIGAVGQRREPDADLVTISRGDSEVWRGVPDVLVVQERHELNRQRLMIKDGCLVGAVLMGDQTLSPFVQNLIESRTNLRAVLPALRRSNTTLADTLIMRPERSNGRVSRPPVRRLRQAQAGNSA